MSKPRTLPVKVADLRAMRENCHRLTGVIQRSGYIPKEEKIALHGINLRNKRLLDDILQLELFSDAQLNPGNDSS